MPKPIENLTGTDATAFRVAIAPHVAALTTILESAQAFNRLIEANEFPANELILTDSTGTGSTLPNNAAGQVSSAPDAVEAFPYDMWPTLRAKYLAAKYPTRPVNYFRMLNTHNGDGTDGPWTQAFVVQSGTGQPINIYNFAIGGAAERTPMGGWTAKIFDNAERSFAHCIVAYGLNTQFSYNNDLIIYRTAIRELLAYLLPFLPAAGLTYVMQHPRYDYPAGGENYAVALQQVAAQFGVSVVWVNDVFAALEDPSIYMNSDEVHENAAGAALVAQVINAATAASACVPPARFQAAVQPRILFQTAFEDWPIGAALPTGWTATNATLSKDLTRPGNAAYSALLRPGSGGNARVSYQLPVADFAGKTITVATRLENRPGANHQTSGAVFLLGTKAGSSRYRIVAQGTDTTLIDGGEELRVTTLTIPSDETSLELRILGTYFAVTSDDGSANNLRSIVITEGSVPGAPDPNQIRVQQPGEQFSALNVFKPNLATGILYSGTLTTTTTGAAIAAATPIAAKAISGVSNAAAAVITAVAHGFVTGQTVRVTGLTAPAIPDANYVVTVLTADTFSIPFNTSAMASYTSGGTAIGSGARFVLKAYLYKGKAYRLTWTKVTGSNFGVVRVAPGADGSSTAYLNTGVFTDGSMVVVPTQTGFHSITFAGASTDTAINIDPISLQAIEEAVDASSGTITLALPTTAPEGTSLTFRKSDTSTNRVTVKVSGGADLAWLMQKSDNVTVLFSGGAWLVTSWRISPIAELVTASGTYTVPPLTEMQRVDMVGGGGGGGGVSAAAATAGGGGAGEARSIMYYGPAPLSAVAVTVGGGGTGGAAGGANNGTAGGNTVFGTETAGGGIGGNGSASGNAATSGVGAIKAGAPTTAKAYLSSAWSAGNAGAGSGVGGAGGFNNILPWGTRGTGSANAAGGNATGYGHGGAGGGSTGASGWKGGDGSPGAILVTTWF